MIRSRGDGLRSFSRTLAFRHSIWQQTLHILLHLQASSAVCLMMLQSLDRLVYSCDAFSGLVTCTTRAESTQFNVAYGICAEGSIALHSSAVRTRRHMAR